MDESDKRAVKIGLGFLLVMPGAWAVGYILWWIVLRDPRLHGPEGGEDLALATPFLAISLIAGFFGIRLIRAARRRS